MLNLYPQRATDFSNVRKTSENALYKNNLKHIRAVLSLPHVSDIWAAWGKDIVKRAFLKDCLHDILAISVENNCRWKNAGELTKCGHPRHPSRMAYNLELNLFDIQEYFSDLK